MRIGVSAALVFRISGKTLFLECLESLRVPEETGHVDEDVLVERLDLGAVALRCWTYSAEVVLGVRAPCGA